jgi:hypothetical protein
VRKPLSRICQEMQHEPVASPEQSTGTLADVDAALVSATNRRINGRSGIRAHEHARSL